MPHTAAAAAFAGLAVGALLVGCAAPVALTPPSPPAEACKVLADQLPDRVAGQERRPTTPASSATAAWGDPPISLRCGVSTPSAYTPGVQLVAVNGVDWLPEQLSNGVRFTALGRLANVEVTVPSAYRPEADALTDLSPVIRSVIPRG
ncbi:MAG: DUF3515 domain-containing protein [Candidatus Nanopelagicales bacterium]